MAEAPLLLSDRQAVDVAWASRALGDRLLARRAFAAGEPVLAELPALVWGADDAAVEDVSRFAQKFEAVLASASDARHRKVRRSSLLALALRARPVLNAWQRTSKRVQQALLAETQGQCGCAEAPLAGAIEAVAEELTRESRSVDCGILARVLACAMVNGYDFEPADREACRRGAPLGWHEQAVFLLGSKIEHSCEPNVEFVVQRTSGDAYCGVFRACRPIAAGEPVRNSYLDDEALAEDTQGRRTALFERYGFVCACARCESDGGVAAAWPLPLVAAARAPKQRPDAGGAGAARSDGVSLPAMPLEHDLTFREQQWQLAISGLSGWKAKELELDIRLDEVRLQALGRQELRISIPSFASIDLDSCGSRLRQGKLTVSWPPFRGDALRECSMEVVSSSPLVIIGRDFLSKAECDVVIAATRKYGKATTSMEHEVKYDMEPHPSAATSCPEYASLLESIYARIDVLCGTARHPDEQVPRVHHYRQRRVSQARMPLGLHLDTNGRPFRYVTAIIYLTTLPRHCDGATVFPCLGNPAAAAAGAQLLSGGTLHSKTLADPDHAPEAASLEAASALDRSFSVHPEAGKLVVFFSRTETGETDGTSWHGGGQHGKWILQFFKEVPARFRSPEAMADFIASRRTLPEFTLHRVHHRCGEAGA